MQNTLPHAPALGEYVDLRELHHQVRHTFPTEDSIRWYIRQNRDALVDAGAIILITGRMRLHPARFQQAAVEICQRAAKSKTP